MNNVNAPHTERKCRIMRRDYGKRYRQTTKVILEIFAPWWITTPTTSGGLPTRKTDTDRKTQIGQAITETSSTLVGRKKRVKKNNIYIYTYLYNNRGNSVYPKKSINIQKTD